MGNCRYDIDGLRQELEVSIGDIAMLFMNYLCEMNENLQEAQTSALSGNYDMLQKIVHNIKGVSVNLGVLDVYKAAEELDVRLKVGNTAEVLVFTDKIKALFISAEKDIKEYFTSNGYSL